MNKKPLNLENQELNLETEKKDLLKEPISNALSWSTDLLSDNVEIIDENGVLKISDLAKAVWLSPEKISLPNGKEIMSIVWKPVHLSQVFNIINKSKVKNTLGKSDLVTIDWACPTRLLPTISHALHPINTAVAYPQWWPDSILPLSGAEIEKDGTAEGVKFIVNEDEEKTSINFELTDASIDVEKAMQTLKAPEVTNGKPVFISWRGPIAIATALAEAYSHKVPFVACFQPWTGRVVCISHSDTKLGTIFE